MEEREKSESETTEHEATGEGMPEAAASEAPTAGVTEDSANQPAAE